MRPPVAQWLERTPYKREVDGSPIPADHKLTRDTRRTEGSFMKFTIDWANLANGFLTLKEENRVCRCALGFYLSACGAPDQHLINEGGEDYEPMDPSVWSDMFPPAAGWVFEAYEQPNEYTNEDEVTVRLSKDASEIAQISDDESMTVEEKEPKLRDLFARHGVEVEFVHASRMDMSAHSEGESGE